MKKHFKYLSMAAIAASMFAACSDVPELPYPFPGDDSDTTIVVVGDNLLENGDFEAWDGNTPTHWKSSTTASSATLAQSTDAHGGSYAVIVQGNSEFNKRIAYKEITLKPGTYYITFYAKGTTGDASVRPGYVAVLADGKADSQNYMYGSYVNNITNSEWTEVKHEFTLDTQKTINLIIMNPKSTASDVLIDDYSLTTADGGLAEEGGSNDDNTGDEEDDPIIPTGGNLVANGDFEAWSNNFPTNWKSTTSASKGNLSQSTDAHSGSYAVQVIGKAETNNRLAYKEITLKAGSYHIQFYTKAAKTNGSSARPGYAPIKADGSMGSYAYGDYVNDLTTTEWTEVNHSFTLTEQTTLNLIIMCAGKPGTDILVDDYTLTTTDGGLVDSEGGEEEEPETPDTPSGTYYSNTLLGDEGSFTAYDISLGSLSYVWQNTTSYGWKASAYSGGAVAAEAWLVSPAIDLSAAKNPIMTFEQALNYLNSGNRADFINLYISTDFANDIAAATWEEVSLDAWPAGSDWGYITSTANLATYAGKSIYIAFKYVSTSSIATTWEFKNLTIAEK